MNALSATIRINALYVEEKGSVTHFTALSAQDSRKIETGVRRLSTLGAAEQICSIKRRASGTIEFDQGHLRALCAGLGSRILAQPGECHFEHEELDSGVCLKRQRAWTASAHENGELKYAVDQCSFLHYLKLYLNSSKTQRPRFAHLKTFISNVIGRSYIRLS